MGSRIVSTGRATPRTCLNNHDMARHMDTSDEWVRTRTGIAQRYVMASGESLVDLAADASRTALARAGIKPPEIEAIVVGTVSSDYGFPSFGCQLQHQLGIDTIPAFDVAAACSGFVYALSVADSSMRAGDWNRVLVIGADALSTMVDWNDRATAVLFGDGAGAVVLVRELGPRGVLGSLLRSSGQYWDLLAVRNRGVQTTIDAEAHRQSEDAIKMKGPELFKLAVKSMADVTQQVAERASVPPEKVFTNVDRYGNTSAASVPIALDEALESNRIRDNDLVMLNACGGGLTWGANLVRW